MRKDITGDAVYRNDEEYIKVHIDLAGQRYAFVCTQSEFAELNTNKGGLIKEISLRN